MLHARITFSPNASARTISSADSAPGFSQTSPTRFRIEGMRDTATFQLSEGRATAVVLEAPGDPSLTLKRDGS